MNYSKQSIRMVCLADVLLSDYYRLCAHQDSASPLTRYPLARASHRLTITSCSMQYGSAVRILDASQAVGLLSDYYRLCAHQDSNLGPFEYQSNALPAELYARISHSTCTKIKLSRILAKFGSNNFFWRSRKEFSTRKPLS